LIKKEKEWIDKALLNEFQDKQEILDNLNCDIKKIENVKEKTLSYILAYTYFDEDGYIVSENTFGGNSYHTFGLANIIMKRANKEFLDD
jgi:hypothetical protein